MQTDRPYYHSSSFKMALLFTLLLGGAVLLLGWTMQQASRESFIYGTSQLIDNELAYVQLLLDRGDSLQSILTRQPKGLYTLLMDNNGKRLGGSLPKAPQSVVALEEGLVHFPYADAEQSMQMAAKIHSFSDGKRLLLARDITETLTRQRHTQWVIGLSMLFMGVVVVISFMLSLFVVKRINLIARTANDIMHTGDLSRRIDIDTRWDDLSNLAGILNQLLDKIVVLMGEIRQVSDNIAHDLRTPLTRLRNRLESLQDVKDTDTVKQEAGRLVEEADHLLETFRALLRIANIESGKRHSAWEEVQLDQLVQDVLELYAPLAEEKTLDLSVKLSPCVRQGDRDLLFQALANLLDNAIKFTPEHGQISVTVEPVDEGVILTIADSGIGIPEAERKHVFARFYRSDSSRNMPGNGLGLSMVAAVVALHRGSISLADNNPGLRVEVTL